MVVQQGLTIWTFLFSAAFAVVLTIAIVVFVLIVFRRRPRLPDQSILSSLGEEPLPFFSRGVRELLYERAEARAKKEKDEGDAFPCRADDHEPADPDSGPLMLGPEDALVAPADLGSFVQWDVDILRPEIPLDEETERRILGRGGVPAKKVDEADAPERIDESAFTTGWDESPDDSREDPW